MSAMTLRTPRRRISPRTKHRYRVIRNFFRKALGATSQSDIKIGSSIAIDVTDLKHKIIGLERQLSEVSRHYQELASLESLSRNSNSIVSEQQRSLATSNSISIKSSESELCGAETKVLYKTPDIKFRKSAASEIFAKTYNNNDEDPMTMNDKYINDNGIQIKKKKNKRNDCIQQFNKRKDSVYENLVSVYSTDNFHNDHERITHYANINDVYNPERHVPFTDQYEAPDYNNKVCKVRTKIYSNNAKTRKSKGAHQLDQDFIADIIKRQYKPTKIFGRRQSDISQFSAPVCRDQEYPNRENLQENPELCSCCRGQHPAKLRKCQALNEMRSVCDTHLYRAKKHTRSKHRRRQFDAYDSELYDLVPVKEKTSPKSRRKFIEDTMKTYDCYREVPPSPRTLRPRLNLKAQYCAEFEDFMARKNLNRKCSPKKMGSQECRDNYESDESQEDDENDKFINEKPNQQNTKIQKQQQIQDNGTSNSLQYPNFVNMLNSVGTSLNKTQEIDLSIDKTDKALCEIKDILQNFLHDIKNETTASQYDKSDFTSKAPETGSSNHQRANVLPNSGHSFNNHSMPQCGMTSFIPQFTNPCCYPILSVYPMNCMQNGYIVSNPSATCATCNNNETGNEKSTVVNKKSTEICSPETEKLIKEIHKYIAQSPKANTREYNVANKEKEAKLLSSRSVGGTTKMSKHDANVGTPTMRCYSKSCEVIGSRMLSDYYCATNPTYSDTVLDKLSLEATPTDSISETDFTTDIAPGKKSKQNRFMKVLQSFGIKKKKKDVIEELSESENTIDVEVMRKQPPFGQEVTNYMKHNQNYYNPPPVPPLHTYHGPHLHEYQEYRKPYPTAVNHHPFEKVYNPHSVHQQTIHEHRAPNFYQTPTPTAPPYPHSYDNYINQNVPLCLKEIEVKSIGTQSVRRMSFFDKLKTKIQQPVETARSQDNSHRNSSTQTAQNKPGLFNWKDMQNKTKDSNPLTLSFLKQKQLAEGDSKMRNAMMKKLFYKKNPFSPGNLLVRTLMGKDKSSFGEPPTMYRPKMFF